MPTEHRLSRPPGICKVTALFMKKTTVIASLIVMLCFIGCSPEGSSSGNSAHLVPPTAAKVMASPDYKLEHTTESGIKCYVRPLAPELARTISVDNPYFEFLKGDDTSPYYLLVLVRNGKLLDKEAAAGGAMTETDEQEVESFVAKRDPNNPQVPPKEADTK
jgi:hypothetical protein